MAAEVYRNAVRDAGEAGNAVIVGDGNSNSVAAALLDRKWLPTVHFYTIAGPGSEVRPLGIVSAPFLPPLIRISPDGRHVVVEKYLTRSDIPSAWRDRSEEHTSELQSLMRISYAVFCLKKKKNKSHHNRNTII